MKNISKQIVDLTKSLIEFPSISSDIKYLNDIVDFVAKYFDGLWYVKQYEFKWKKTIVIQNFKWEKADILFSGHLDVVPANPDQFSPKVVWNKLYGRGALDMKSGVAIMMLLMKNLLKKWYKDKCVGLMLNTDEEIGWVDGAWPMVSKIWYRADVVIIPDWWNINNIIYAEKWTIHLTVIAKWKATHASKRWSWDSAIDKMIKLYEDLRSKIEEKDKMIPSKWYWSSSVNLTNIQAWTWAANVIPDIATWIFDIRYTEKFTSKQIVDLIKKTIKTHWVELNSLFYWEMLFSDPRNKNIKKYHSIAKSIIWKSVKLWKDHVASDGRFFWEFGSVVILHQPDWGNIHWVGEYSEISNYKTLYQIYEKFVLE